MNGLSIFTNEKVRGWTRLCTKSMDLANESFTGKIKGTAESAVPKCFLTEVTAAEAWVAAFLLVARQASELLPAAASPEVAQPTAAASSAAAPADLCLVAAVLG
jgi:hypothetical protein